MKIRPSIKGAQLAVAAQLDTRGDHEGVPDRSGSRLARAVRHVRKHGAGEDWRLAREQGWSGSANFVYRNLRYMLAVQYGRAFDRANGVDTGGDVPAAFLDTTSDNRGFGHQFVPTSVRSFNYIMKLLPPDLSGFSFVDIGSGKGRTLLLAARHPFRQILGIEYARSLVDVAVRNVARYRGPPLRCTDIESVCADATTVSLPRWFSISSIPSRSRSSTRCSRGSLRATRNRLVRCFSSM